MTRRQIVRREDQSEGAIGSVKRASADFLLTNYKTTSETGVTAVHRSKTDAHYPAYDLYTSMACASISLCNTVNLLGTLATKETTPSVARAQPQ